MDVPRRKANRLTGFDYSACFAYFITIRVRKGGPCLWKQAIRAGIPSAGEQYDGKSTQSPPYSVGAAISRPSQWQGSRRSDAATPCPPLSAIGELVDQAICSIPEHYPQAEVNKYCIMPDHLHLILFLTAEEPGGLAADENGRLIAAPTPGRKPSASQIMGQMKRWVSLHAGSALWQKSFYDRIIRNEKEYAAIWQYIDENPLKQLNNQ